MGKRMWDKEEIVQIAEEHGGEGGGAVKSVNGKTGEVELIAADVGATTEAYVGNYVAQELVNKQDKLESWSDTARVEGNTLILNYKVRQEDNTYSDVPVEFTASGGSASIDNKTIVEDEDGNIKTAVGGYVENIHYDAGAFDTGAFEYTGADFKCEDEAALEKVKLALPSNKPMSFDITYVVDGSPVTETFHMSNTPEWTPRGWNVNNEYMAWNSDNTSGLYMSFRYDYTPTRLHIWWSDNPLSTEITNVAIQHDDIDIEKITKIDTKFIDIEAVKPVLDRYESRLFYDSDGKLRNGIKGAIAPIGLGAWTYSDHNEYEIKLEYDKSCLTVEDNKLTLFAKAGYQSNVVYKKSDMQVYGNGRAVPPAEVAEALDRYMIEFATWYKNGMSGEQPSWAHGGVTYIRRGDGSYWGSGLEMLNKDTISYSYDGNELTINIEWSPFAKVNLDDMSITWRDYFIIAGGINDLENDPDATWTYDGGFVLRLQKTIQFDSKFIPVDGETIVVEDNKLKAVGGGGSETTETWTFIMTDGTVVTKQVVVK